MNIQQIGCKNKTGMKLVQNCVQWQAVVLAKLNLQAGQLDYMKFL
jgi:hypothetical protein